MKRKVFIFGTKYILKPGWEDVGVKKQVLSAMLGMLELDQLPECWRPAGVEDAFLGLFIRTAFMLLENPPNCRSGELKRALVTIVGTLKWN